MDYGTPGLPVHYQVPEFAQTHVHWVRDSSRIIEAEKWIIELEDRMVEITEAEQNKKKELKNEDSPRDLLDDIKCINIQIIGVLEEDKMAWENIWGDYSQKLP